MLISRLIPICALFLALPAVAAEKIDRETIIQRDGQFLAVSYKTYIAGRSHVYRAKLRAEERAENRINQNRRQPILSIRFSSEGGNDE